MNWQNFYLIILIALSFALIEKRIQEGVSAEKIIVLIMLNNGYWRK